MERPAEINVAYEIRTPWGRLAVVELHSARGIMAKVITVPSPAIVIRENQLATTGIAIPDRRGKIPGEAFGLDGTKLHIIDWKNVLNGGGSIADRKRLELNGISSKTIPVRHEFQEYHNVLKGQGFLSGKPIRI